MPEWTRAELWQSWAIGVSKHRRGTRTRLMVDYVAQLKTLAQRTKEDRRKKSPQ